MRTLPLPARPVRIGEPMALSSRQETTHPVALLDSATR
jgi:hypothetical protein